ncbi:MAG: hypothetical protein DRP62_06460 [Planctomycetota bacterium]|nr:MAG: hypothetical protein DRP62_06460 [Planctomycetota bacterium]
MRLSGLGLFVCIVVFSIGTVQADWCENNKDGTSGGGLDQPGWVAAWNGSSPNPATNWYTAAELAPVYGTDPGWTGNVVNITDDDATAYAAINKLDDEFTDVRATVSVSTNDLDEEFGAIIRADSFGHGDPITAVSAYAATFSANNALYIGDPMKFTLYKIVNGGIEYSEVKNPGVPADSDDLIVFIELTAIGNNITARLFDDADSTIPLSTIVWEDNTGTPLTSGHTGVINLDYESADGISSYYDTLCSVVIPEPATVVLLALGGLALLRKKYGV